MVSYPHFQGLLVEPFTRTQLWASLSFQASISAPRLVRCPYLSIREPATWNFVVLTIATADLLEPGSCAASCLWSRHLSHLCSLSTSWFHSFWFGTRACPDSRPSFTCSAFQTHSVTKLVTISISTRYLDLVCPKLGHFFQLIGYPNRVLFIGFQCWILCGWCSSSPWCDWSNCCLWLTWATASKPCPRT